MMFRKLFVIIALFATDCVTLFARPPHAPSAVASPYGSPPEQAFTTITSPFSASEPAVPFTFHHRDRVILLHLTAANNQVLLRVMNSLGDCVHILEKENLPQGFYEFPLLHHSKPSSGIYAIKLAVNGRLTAFQTTF